MSSTNVVAINPGIPVSGDILSGNSTTNNGTIITIPAGRTWVGSINISGSVVIPAAQANAADARPNVTSQGTNVTPAAGTFLAKAICQVGANAAAGTVGGSSQNSLCVYPVYVQSPSSNSTSLQFSFTVTGTGATGLFSASANGILL
jgi:hypothetical protein